MVDKDKVKKKNLPSLLLHEFDDDGDSNGFKQNFDLITPESDEPEKKYMWGLPVPEFVPETFVSWMEYFQEDEKIELHGDNVVKKVGSMNDFLHINLHTNKKKFISNCYLI